MIADFSGEGLGRARGHNGHNGQSGAQKHWVAEAALMTTDLDTRAAEERRSMGRGIRKLLFIVVLALLFFLLAHDMVRHRFFRGGWRNQHGSISP